MGTSFGGGESRRVRSYHRLPRRPLGFSLPLLIVIWLFAVTGSWAWFTNYEFSTNSGTSAQKVWPSDSELSRDESQSTLLIFIHPQCPCSRASVNELERVLLSTQRQGIRLPVLKVVACYPLGRSEDWRKAELVRRSQELPNATVWMDSEGIESKNFGINTSGSLMLFDRFGDCLFVGGITGSRGHEGESLSAVQLKLALAGNPSALDVSWPAFGCLLCEPSTGKASDGICDGSYCQIDSPNTQSP